MPNPLSGCNSGFTLPTSGFPSGYCIRQWNGTNWNLMLKACASGFNCPPQLLQPEIIRINALLNPTVGTCAAFSCQ
jgi:hypothetical protein